MHNNFLSISAHQNSEMLVVQFKPGGAHPFLKKPIHEFNNKVKPAEDIFGTEINELRSAILRASNEKEIFALIDSWLHQIHDPFLNANDEILHVLHGLEETSYKEHDLFLKEYSKSQKHLIDQFKKYVGLTPKLTHRIFRFNSILKSIHQKEIIDWLTIAEEFGYTDQSHFIKEFKEFSGFNPKEFISFNHHKKPTNFFPLKG